MRIHSGFSLDTLFRFCNAPTNLSIWINFARQTPAGYVHNLISNGGDDSSANLRIVTDDPAYGGNDYLQFVCGPGQKTFALASPVRQTWWQFTALRSGNVLSLFRNGSLLTNGVMTGAVNTSQIWFGRHISWAVYPAVVVMDEVRMYNRALSASEVQQLYQYESLLISLVKAVKPSFANLALGTNYQLQVSGDLTTWTNQGSPFTATNTSMVYPQYWDVDNWGKLFFRLQVAP